MRTTIISYLLKTSVAAFLLIVGINGIVQQKMKVKYDNNGNHKMQMDSTSKPLEIPLIEQVKRAMSF